MTDQVKVKNTTIRVVREDITLFDTDAFMFYAQNDLALSTGFGGAIAVRGGASIQQELDEMAPVEDGETVISKAGKLPAEHILHVVGPKFQEENIEEKLHAAILKALEMADEHEIKRVAVPPMGRGFYCVPLPDSARITVKAIKDYLAGDTNIEEVVICVNDHAEVDAMKAQL